MKKYIKAVNEIIRVLFSNRSIGQGQKVLRKMMYQMCVTCGIWPLLFVFYTTTLFSCTRTGLPLYPQSRNDVNFMYTTIENIHAFYGYVLSCERHRRTYISNMAVCYDDWMASDDILSKRRRFLALVFSMNAFLTDSMVEL